MTTHSRHLTAVPDQLILLQVSAAELGNILTALAAVNVGGRVTPLITRLAAKHPRNVDAWRYDDTDPTPAHGTRRPDTTA